MMHETKNSSSHELVSRASAATKRILELSVGLSSVSAFAIIEDGSLQPLFAKIRVILDAAGGTISGVEVKYFRNIRTIARTSFEMWLEDFRQRLKLLADAQSKKSGKRL